MSGVAAGKQGVPRFDRDYRDPEVARHYAEDRWTATAHARRTDRSEQRIVAALLARLPGVHTVLDVPCGAGRMLPLLREAGFAVTGCDAAGSILAHAVARGERGALASADALPFRDGAFDAVLCVRLLHHYAHPADRVAVLRELARVARRGVVASWFDRRSFQAWRHRVRGKKPHRFPISAAALAGEAAQAGLTLTGRMWVARGISEQAFALLEKRA